MTFKLCICFWITWTFVEGHVNEVNDKWIDDDLTFINSTFICNIDVWEGSQEEFLSRYAFKLPVVINRGSNNEHFRKLCSKSYLLNNFGDLTVRLSSANSFSYEKVDVKFKNYVKNMLIPTSQKNKLGNETYYFFGDALPDEFNSILQYYKPPPYYLPSTVPAFSFGIAGTGTGVPFHFHGPGFSETIHGRKHWFFYPPNRTPLFHPNETSLHWFLNYDFYNDKDLLQCSVGEGQLIYFPNHWWHSTLNLEPSIFVSTFLAPV